MNIKISPTIKKVLIVEFVLLFAFLTFMYNTSNIKTDDKVVQYESVTNSIKQPSSSNITYEEMYKLNNSSVVGGDTINVTYLYYVDGPPTLWELLANTTAAYQASMKKLIGG
jgi:hypothetical protein